MSWLLVPLQPLQPVFNACPALPRSEMGRAGALRSECVAPRKVPRIDAMDEISAPWNRRRNPLKNLAAHLGERADGWSQRSIEYAIVALEHLGAFAHPLGVPPARGEPGERAHHTGAGS